MAEENDLLTKIRASVDLMAAISENYGEGKITYDNALKQLTELEADIKALDPEFPIMNAAATLDEVDRMLSGDSEYYESSEYNDEDY